MAGVHLPDIGKLGIHVATGLLDKKKVAPVNMAEEARLKAFLNRIEKEKDERFKILKKDFRRMKRRKRRIDERLQDIGRSKTISFRVEGRNFKHISKIDTHLPPIQSASVPKKSQKKLKNNTREDVTLKDDYIKGSVSKTTIFPIQDELVTTKQEKSILPPLVSPLTQEIACNKKQKTEKTSRKVSNQSQMTDEISLKKTKRKSLALNSEDGSRGSRSVSLEEADVDTNLFLSSLDAMQMRRRKEPQQSLEDALNAIKACRYIRTPSRQASETSEEVVNSDNII